MENIQEHLLLPSSSSFSNPHLMSISTECWSVMEPTTQEILCAIQPTIVSEDRRKEIIDYIRWLIRDYFGNEVLLFGSMPLKTYLPDGDVDLTALCPENAEEDFARDICTILEGERQRDTGFQVKAIKYIPAKVKLVKCIVQDIPVDISFNQIAGLSTLCFLELVDILIGKDHLFKRSIILIKAWCYYEGQILGSHCGLLSTYALEVLILNVINLFHQSLHCPLAVLYIFLDYYSQFDWEVFGVGILGPVAISSLLTGSEETENFDRQLLITKEFLSSCKEVFAVPTRASESSTIQLFPTKHINIRDPLKDFNNLGRSISEGNFHRVTYAISFGAKWLRKILMLDDQERMKEELKEFFGNSLDNNRRQMANEGGPFLFGFGSSEFCNLQGDYESCLSNLHCGQLYHANHFSPSLQHISMDFPIEWIYSNQDCVPCEYTSSCFPMPPSLNANQFVEPTDQFDEEESNMNVYATSEPFYLQPATLFSGQLPGPAYHFEEKVKSRGTGTYLPDRAQISYNELHRWESGQHPELACHSEIPQRRWDRKWVPVSTASSKLLEPEQEEGKSTQSPLQGPLPKPEEDGRMVANLKSQAPALKPAQEMRRSEEIMAQGPILKPKAEIGETSEESKTQGPMLKSKAQTGQMTEEFKVQSPMLKPKAEMGQMSQEFKVQGPMLKPKFGTGKLQGFISQGLLPIPEGLERMNSESTFQGPSMKPRPANRNHILVSPALDKAGTRNCINTSLEEFPELPRKPRQEISIDQECQKNGLSNQPYQLGDHRDFPPLARKQQKGKGKGQKKR